jgi:hypothetical protein
MSPLTPTHTTLTRTSQSRREAGLLRAVITPALELCNSPSTTSSPQNRSSHGGVRRNAGGFGTVHPRTAFVAEAGSSEPTGDSAVWLRRHPYIDALQMGVSIERQFSPYFPCFPSVTRFGADPAPHHPSTHRPHAGTPILRTASFCFFWTPPPTRCVGSLSRKCSSCLGSGAHSRRRAQECPEGNPGKYKQGETPWHSTKTT